VANEKDFETAVIAAFKDRNRIMDDGSIITQTIHLYNHGNFMLFEQPCNRGGKKIYDCVILEVIDICPSTNSSSFYAKVMVEMILPTGDSEKMCGYVSLRAAALTEAHVATDTTKDRYIECITKVNDDWIF
jgi:hypothetical protein